MSDKEIQEDVAVKERQELKEPKKYKVIIHDNPYTSFQEVIFVVTRVFNMTENQAMGIAESVHEKGKGICGVYSYEIAETKITEAELAKEYLCNSMPFRAGSIKELKFTIEEA